MADAGEEKKAKHAYSIHQDGLLWSRVQTLIALQTAVLGGTVYFYRSKDQPEEYYLAIPLICLGLILTVVLWIIMERDQLHRERSRMESGVRKTQIAPSFPLKFTGGSLIRFVIFLL